MLVVRGIVNGLAVFVGFVGAMLAFAYMVCPWNAIAGVVLLLVGVWGLYDALK